MTAENPTFLSSEMADTSEYHQNEATAPGRHVVFNADDFGYTSGINEAIALAHGGGLLKSASLMASGGAFDQAVCLAHSLEDFGVGVHLCTTQTRSCLPANEIPDLVDGIDGRFRLSLPELGLRLLSSPRLAGQVIREWRAQIERILGEGIHPDHLNSHQHVHMHPALFDKCLELAEEFNIPVVRMPHTNFWLNAKLDSSGLPQKLFKALVFGTLRSSCLALHRAEEYGVLLADHTYGLLQIGRTDDEYLAKLLPHLPGGFSEIYIHPGVRPEPCSPWIKRDMELAALLSARVREAVEQQGLTITTFRRWAEASRVEAADRLPAQSGVVALSSNS